MEDVDIPIRLFSSSYNFFYTSSNPHRDTTFTNPLALISSSNIPWFLTFYHSLSYVLFQLINLIRSLFIKLFYQKILYGYISTLSLPYEGSSSYLGREVLLPNLFSNYHFDIAIFPLSYPLIPYISILRFLISFTIYTYLKIYLRIKYVNIYLIHLLALLFATLDLI